MSHAANIIIMKHIRLSQIGDKWEEQNYQINSKTVPFLISEQLLDAFTLLINSMEKRIQYLRYELHHWKKSFFSEQLSLKPAPKNIIKIAAYIREQYLSHTIKKTIFTRVSL